MGYSGAITVLPNPNVAHPAQIPDNVVDLHVAATGSTSLPDTALILDPSLLLVAGAFASFALVVVLAVAALRWHLLRSTPEALALAAPRDADEPGPAGVASSAIAPGQIAPGPVAPGMP